MPNYTPRAKLQTDFGAYATLPHKNWNRLVDGVDLQTWGLGSAIGNGVIAGGQILSSKQVGPTIAIIGGMYGASTSNQSIEDLVSGATNKVWLCRVDPPSSGGEFDLSHESTFNVGTLRFVASDVQPSNSLLLGTITLAADGSVTAIDQSSSGNWPIHIVGACVARIVRNVTVEDLPYNEAYVVTVDHSSEALFLVPGALVIDTNDDVQVSDVENHEPGRCRFTVLASSSVYAYGYGYTTTARFTVVRYGIVRPSPWIWDYGS